MSKTKGGGSTRNGRDSNAKRLGVKVYGGEQVIPGNIIIRQRGTEYRAGQHVGMGKDHTLYALEAGQVLFAVKGKARHRVVSVVTSDQKA